MKYSTVLILFFTFTSVFAKNVCPNAKPVDVFNFIAYSQSTWYEVARYKNELENGDCVVMNSTQKDYGFQIEVSEVINRTRLVYDGILVQPPGVRNVGILDYILKDYQVQMKVLAVDYMRYAVEYNCEFDASKGTIKETGWIMSRSKEMSNDTRKEIYETLKSFKFINCDKLIWDNFSDETCAHDTEDIDRDFPESLLQQIPSK